MAAPAPFPSDPTLPQLLLPMRIRLGPVRRQLVAVAKAVAWRRGWGQGRRPLGRGRCPWRWGARLVAAGSWPTTTTAGASAAVVVGNGLDARRCHANGKVRSGRMYCLIGGGGGRHSCAAAVCSRRVVAPSKRFPWGSGGTVALKGMGSREVQLLGPTYGDGEADGRRFPCLGPRVSPKRCHPRVIQE
jgi:hypothetical protein